MIRRDPGPSPGHGPGHGHGAGAGPAERPQRWERSRQIDGVRRLRRLRRRVRAVVLGRRRLLAALCLGVAVALAVQARTAPPPPTVAVPVAARDLPAGARIAAGDVRLVAFRPGSAPAGLVPARRAVGATTAGPVRAGEPLTDVRLLGPGLLAAHPGTVALPVSLADTAVLRLLRPGDRVDVLAADPQRRRDAVTVASDAPVLLVPPRPEASAPGGGGLVLVAVDEATARRVAGHAVASYLSVVLLGRPTG